MNLEAGRQACSQAWLLAAKSDLGSCCSAPDTHNPSTPDVTEHTPRPSKHLVFDHTQGLDLKANVLWINCTYNADAKPYFKVSGYTGG